MNWSATDAAGNTCSCFVHGEDRGHHQADLDLSAEPHGGRHRPQRGRGGVRGQGDGRADGVGAGQRRHFGVISFFALGETTRNCSAADAAGNLTSGAPSRSRSGVRQRPRSLSRLLSARRQPARTGPLRRSPPAPATSSMETSGELRRRVVFHVRGRHHDKGDVLGHDEAGNIGSNSSTATVVDTIAPSIDAGADRAP